MKAKRAFDLIVSRGGIEPAFLADPARLDRIEVVSIDDGEVVLFWELPAKQAARLLKSLRTDLAPVERFLKEMSVPEAEPQSKLTVQPSSTESETKVVVLEPRG